MSSSAPAASPDGACCPRDCVTDCFDAIPHQHIPRMVWSVPCEGATHGKGSSSSSSLLCPTHDATVCTTLTLSTTVCIVLENPIGHCWHLCSRVLRPLGDPLCAGNGHTHISHALESHALTPWSRLPEPIPPLPNLHCSTLRCTAIRAVHEPPAPHWTAPQASRRGRFDSGGRQPPSRRSDIVCRA